jgi:hypothetical protein
MILKIKKFFVRTQATIAFIALFVVLISAMCVNAADCIDAQACATTTCTKTGMCTGRTTSVQYAIAPGKKGEYTNQDTYTQCGQLFERQFAPIPYCNVPTSQCGGLLAIPSIENCPPPS